MFTKKTWSYDPNAIYLVILGKGIKESVATGFNLCTDYCGHHSTALNTTAQKYYIAVVGLPTVCPACITIAIQKLSPTDPAS
jgi:hypothetical protein